MKRNDLFKRAAIEAGLDVTKDYFSLSSSDIAKVEELRKVFKYSGRNYLGRSKTRQFWYAIQK